MTFGGIIRMEMIKLVTLLSILSGLIYFVASACTFPSSLQGEWESPAKGNLTITSSEIVGYEFDTYTNLTFYCELRSGSTYIVKSDNFSLLAGNEVYALLCLQFTKRTSNKYTYFLLTSELADADNERIVYMDATVSPVTEAMACDDTSQADTPQNTKLLVRYGEASNEAIQCPDDILGRYTYNNWTACNDSLWDTCTDLTTMSFDYSVCNETPIGYSAGGNVKCLYKVADGTQVVTYVYNTDATVNETASIYQYTCMVIDLDADGYVYVSQYPLECQENQTSSSVDSPGERFQLYVNYTCVPTNSTTEAATAEVSQAGLIAGLVVLFLIIIAVVVVVVIFFLWKKKKSVSPTVEGTKQTVEAPIPPKEPILLEKPDGRETISPSAMSAHIQSRSGSHGKYVKKLNKKIKAQPVISPRTIPRPLSHHALKRIRGKQITANILSIPKDNITLTKITMKDSGMKREETFYSTFNSIPSTNPTKAKKAPTKLQLELPTDQTYQPLSRASTILSTGKIQLDISSNRTTDNDKVTTRKEKRVPKSDTIPPRTPRQFSRKTIRSRPVTRDRGRMSVKPVKNAASYAKKANTLKGVKLKPKTFKKNVKLVGIVKRPKQQRIKSEKAEKRITVSNTEKSLIAFDVMHDTDRTGAPNKTRHTPEAKYTSTLYTDIEDTNFFMCSNETDNLPPVEKETDQKEETGRNNTAKNSVEITNCRPQTPLMVKPMPAKHHKFVLPKFKNIQPPAFNFSAIVDKARKVSKTKANKLKMKKDRTDFKTDSTEETSALSSFIKDLKSKVKKTRHRKRQEMPALSRYARIPTLVNWVEYSGILLTPSMQMQQRLANNHDKTQFN